MCASKLWFTAPPGALIEVSKVVQRSTCSPTFNGIFEVIALVESSWTFGHRTFKVIVAVVRTCVTFLEPFM